MRIDVTDLFDDLFAIATIAYSRFRFIPTKDEWAKLDEWDAFCASLSDSFFVSLVANRANELTGQKLEAAEVKRRIITRHEMGVDGKSGFNLPYEYPLFFHSFKRPCAFAGKLTTEGSSRIYPSLFRPKHSLTLFLGKLPEYEFFIDRVPHNPKSDSPKLYCCTHGYETMFSGTVTKFYEVQDNWILREITLGDRLSRHTLVTPWWQPTEHLVKIDRELFQNMWDLAQTDNAK